MKKAMKRFFRPTQRVRVIETVPQTTSDPLSATPSTSHPVGCEILFEGDNPIVAEYVPFQWPIHNI